MTEKLAYRALALQIACHAVNQCPDRASARLAWLERSTRIARHVRAAKGFLGQDVRLVVLPEYFLTGYPLGESIPEWSDKAALAPEGAEYAGPRHASRRTTTCSSPATPTRPTRPSRASTSRRAS